MFKKILIIVLLSLSLLQGTAFALDTEGDIIFKNALYGAAIGAILGGAFYLVDDENFGAKFGTGVVIGTLGGLAFGITEVSGLVELDQDKVKFAVPTPVIEKKADGLQYSAYLFKTRF